MRSALARWTAGFTAAALGWCICLIQSNGESSSSASARVSTTSLTPSVSSDGEATIASPAVDSRMTGERWRLSRPWLQERGGFERRSGLRLARLDDAGNGQVVFDSFEERFTRRSEGFEQTFHFERAPEGTTDVSVCFAVSGLALKGESAEGLSFRGAAVVYNAGMRPGSMPGVKKPR